MMNSPDRPASRPPVYPVFLPHAGCPFRCVYCDQEAATSRAPSDPLESFNLQIHPLLAERTRTGRPGEIAFYGGTFTALPLPVVEQLLDVAAEKVLSGEFTSIRFSTRPDCLAPRVCSLLEKYPVGTVELGVQSLCDEVLRESRRGYDASTVEKAAGLVGRRHWTLGLQLMAGLPGDTLSRFRRSVSRAVALKPAFLRIYPTLVFAGTVLARWYREGAYRPLELDEAVEWCAWACERCREAGVAVIRMGLHEDPRLSRPGTVLAGPRHPAFGYLVRVRWWRKRVEGALEDWQGTSTLLLRVPKRFLSEAVGPGRANVEYWRGRWDIGEILVEGEPAGEPGEFWLSRSDRKAAPLSRRYRDRFRARTSRASENGPLSGFDKE